MLKRVVQYLCATQAKNTQYEIRKLDSYFDTVTYYFRVLLQLT